MKSTAPLLAESSMMAHVQPAVRMTYIGGPTLMIEFRGLKLLTDPTFDSAGSEYSNGFVTLEKTDGPALKAALSKIDLVLLSHDHHYDNLDQAGRNVLTQPGRY